MKEPPPPPTSHFLLRLIEMQPPKPPLICFEASYFLNQLQQIKVVDRRQHFFFLPLLHAS